MEPKICSGCCAWQYQSSNFSKPEGERMTGYCRVWAKSTNQSDGCDQFSSQAEQTRQYLERVRSTQTANKDAVE